MNWFCLTFGVFLSLSHCGIHGEGSDNSEIKSDSVWGNIWKVSCDFVREKGRSSTHRVRRSVNKWNSLDFNDPEQLFDYLYPLAHVQKKDLVEIPDEEGESGRSNSKDKLPLHSKLTGLVYDFLEFWHTECELNEMSKDRDNENQHTEEKEHLDDDDEIEESDLVEYIDAENEDEALLDDSDDEDQMQMRQSRSQSESTRFRHDHEMTTKRSYFTSLVSNPNSKSSLHTNNMSIRSLSYPPTNMTIMGKLNNYGNQTGNQIHRRRRRKKKKQPGESQLPSMNSRVDAYSQSTTESSSTSSTVASTKGSSSPDPFFSAYGGDIEYFFPLLSFGIPFDGEITLLGFHGFKGIFPYRR